MFCKEFKTDAERDFKTIWHPFTQAKRPPLVFVKGEKSSFFTADGKGYLDAISSWWVNLHGHCEPYIGKKIAEQVRKLEHVIFTDFTHLPAINFTEKLLEQLPQGFSRVFYSDNGSTAVECALKIAILSFYNLGRQRKKIISLKGGYHGDTFGSMSCAGTNLFTLPFQNFLFEVIAIDPPSCGSEEKALRQMNEIEEPLAFIYEPLIQGASGMRIHSQKGLNELLKVAKSKGAVLIADEVMTGFGRTGPLFVSSTLETTPDIIALSKGITGGFLPLGATVVKERVFSTFEHHPFLHGHSYTGNPLALTAALASFELLLRPSCKEARKRIEDQHRKFCERWNGHSHLKRLEYLGTILVIEYRDSPPPKELFLGEQIILRPLGNVYYVIPPYCIEDEELKYIYKVLEKTWN